MAVYGKSIQTVRLLLIFIAVAALCGDARAAADEAPLITRMAVTIADAPPGETDWEAMARGLILMAPGQRFAAADLEASLEALKQSRRFEHIHADSHDGAGGMALSFELTPFRLVRDIRIRGKFPLFEKEILRAMGLYVGDIYIAGRAARQAARVQKLYQGEGYPTPRVDISAHRDARDGHIALGVAIHKGPYRVLDRLDFVGNRAFGDARLKLKMKVWRARLRWGWARRFIEKDLREDIRRLTRFYRRKGFAEVRIDVETRPASDSTKVQATVHIDEGPRYEVTFSGNQGLKNRRLKKEVVFFQEGDVGGSGLRKSLRRLEALYRSRGFGDVQITAAAETLPAEPVAVRKVRFDIAEGPLSTVAAVTLRGHRSLSTERIQKQMLTRTPGFLNKGIFRTERLEDDLEAIKTVYRQQGFLEPRIESRLQQDPRDGGVTVGLDIQEGPRTVVSGVQIRGLATLTADQAYATLRMTPGQPFRSYMVQSDENALAALISEQGYPHVQVRGHANLSADRHSAELFYEVDQGPLVRVGQVHYRGNFRTRAYVLERELKVARGDPFSLARLLEGQRSLRSLDLFDTVQIQTVGLKEQRDSVSLFVELEQKKPYFVELGGGYETDRGVFFSSRVGDRNLWGTQRSGWLGGEISEIGYQAEGGILDPRLWGSRVRAALSLSAERREEFNQDFGVTSAGAVLGLSLPAWHNLTPGLRLRFEQREQFQLGPPTTLSAAATEEFEPRNLVAINPLLRYDTRDSFIRPRKGLLSAVDIDLSNGLENNLDDFVAYRFDQHLYYSPLERLTLALRGRLGHILPYGGNARVPSDQLFYLGGTGSVRGFSENLLRRDASGDPLGGRTALSASLEARYDLGRKFELTLFYDLGRLSNTLVADEASGFRSSLGGGLRYITPIGPIGFLYGFKLDPQAAESSGRLHFSIGYSF